MTNKETVDCFLKGRRAVNGTGNLWTDGGYLLHYQHAKLAQHLTPTTIRLYSEWQGYSQTTTKILNLIRAQCAVHGKDILETPKIPSKYD